MNSISKALSTLVGKKKDPLDVLIKGNTITREAKDGEKSKKSLGQRGIHEGSANETDSPMPGFAYGTEMLKSLNIPREDMPQIKMDDIEDYVKKFKDNDVVVKKIKVRLSSLKPTQKDINEDFILSRIKEKSTQYKERLYVVSEEKNLLDGHHDWAYGLEVDPKVIVNAYKIMLPIKKLIFRSNKMKMTQNRDIDNKLQKAIDVIRDIQLNPENYSEEIVEKAKHYEIITVRGKSKVFKRKQLIGTDEVESEKKVANIEEKSPNKTKKAKEKSWYTDLNEKHRFSKLPVNIPKESVTIDLDGDVDSKAVMRWKDPKTGNEVRSYTSKFMEANAQKKWKRVTKLDLDTDKKIVSHVNKNLKDINSKKDQSLAILGIIAITGLRPGSRKLYSITKNRGVSTLGPNSIEVKSDVVSFKFIGKSHKENVAKFKNAKIAKFLSELKEKNKDKEFLFDVSTTRVADHILKKELNFTNFKLKDLRTYQASKTAIEFLHSSEMAPPPMPKEGKIASVKKKILRTYEIVSEKLNNTPAMTKKSYVPPMIIEDWIREMSLEPSSIISKAHNNEINSTDKSWKRMRIMMNKVDGPDEDILDEYGEDEDIQFEIPNKLMRLLND